jgi:hypothetical protein
MTQIDVQITYLPLEKFGSFLKKDDAMTKELVRDLDSMVATPK